MAVGCVRRACDRGDAHRRRNKSSEQLGSRVGLLPSGVRAPHTKSRKRGGGKCAAPPRRRPCPRPPSRPLHRPGCRLWPLRRRRPRPAPTPRLHLWPSCLCLSVSARRRRRPRLRSSLFPRPRQTRKTRDWVRACPTSWLDSVCERRWVPHARTPADAGPQLLRGVHLQQLLRRRRRPAGLSAPSACSPRPVHARLRLAWT
jgi:hypothetical protein